MLAALNTKGTTIIKAKKSRVIILNYYLNILNYQLKLKKKNYDLLKLKEKKILNLLIIIYLLI